MTYSEFRKSQKTFASAEGNLKYIDQGKGEVMVLLHGIPTSGWLYRHMIDELSKKFRIIVPDMLGFGNSDSPKGYDIYSGEQHASRLLALLDSLEIKHWTHVMHDAGGLWTWELVKQQPNRISKLVILNTIIYEAGFEPPIRFDKGTIAQLAMWGYRNKITSRLMLKGLLKSGLKDFNLEEDAIEGYHTPMREGKTKAMYYFFTQTCNELPDYSAILSNLDIPILVLWGKHDDFLHWEPQAEAIIKDLQIQSKNIHILNAKHFIQEELPSQLIQFILEFSAAENLA